jgi:hypothetical protein
LTIDHVLAFRLARHRLDRRAPHGSMLEVARGLCGVHAQLASSAELALWARVEGRLGAFLGAPVELTIT